MTMVDRRWVSLFCPSMGLAGAGTKIPVGGAYQAGELLGGGAV